jgi:hypothetical protein
MTCVTKTMKSGWRLESKLCSKLQIITPHRELDHATYNNILMNPTDGIF